MGYSVNNRPTITTVRNHFRPEYVDIVVVNVVVGPHFIWHLAIFTPQHAKVSICNFRKLHNGLCIHLGIEAMACFYLTAYVVLIDSSSVLEIVCDKENNQFNKWHNLYMLASFHAHFFKRSNFTFIWTKSLCVTKANIVHSKYMSNTCNHTHTHSTYTTNTNLSSVFFATYIRIRSLANSLCLYLFHCMNSMHWLLIDHWIIWALTVCVWIQWE